MFRAGLLRNKLKVDLLAELLELCRGVVYYNLILYCTRCFYSPVGLLYGTLSARNSTRPYGGCSSFDI